MLPSPSYPSLVRFGTPLRTDRRGATALFAAVIIVVLLFFTGLSVDFGLALFSKRKLQAATDSAALAASQNPANRGLIVSSLLAANGEASAVVTSLDSGAYIPNSKLPPASRYQAGVVPANAVQLSTSQSIPMRFASALVPHAQVSVSAQASAVQMTEAGLQAGSGLVEQSGGLPNAVLGGLLGSQLSLSLANYNGMANAQVNALDFLNALAVQANVTAGTYGQLLTGSLSMGQVLAAEVAALNKEGSVGGAQLAATQALQSMSADLLGSPSVALGNLFSAGLWSNAQVGSIDPTSALNATLNVYHLTTAAAQVANGGHLVQASLPVTIPGVASVSMAMTAIEPLQSAYFAVGPAGATTVHTAQIRLQLTVKLLSGFGSGSQAAPVSLPLYEELASGTATLSAISCGANPEADATVSVLAQSGVSNVYVGQVQPDAMTNVTQPVQVSPGQILTTPLVSVVGQATAAVQGSQQSLTFSQQQIVSLTPQTVSSTAMTSNLLQSLQSGLVLQTQPVGVPGVTPAIAALLSPVFASLDGVTDQILRALGLRVGYLDVTVNGVRCGVPALFH